MRIDVRGRNVEITEELREAATALVAFLRDGLLDPRAGPDLGLDATATDGTGHFTVFEKQHLGAPLLRRGAARACDHWARAPW